MKLRVLLGAVMVALILVGSAAQADFASAASDVQTLEVAGIPASTMSGPEGVPAASSEHSLSKDDGSDGDQDPVVKVRQIGLLINRDPTRPPAAGKTVQYLSGRPPAPPPKPGGSAKNLTTRIASVGAESAGSEFPPQNIAAIHGAQTFLSSTSAPPNVARAQALAGDDDLAAAPCSALPLCVGLGLSCELISFETKSSSGSHLDMQGGVICRFEL